jgi:hypothetical protein
MRLLARLLIVINRGREMSTGDHGHRALTLSNIIVRQYFDVIVEATKEICGATTDESGRNTFMRPSLGTKIGHGLLKCAYLKKTEAIKCKEKKMVKQADYFISLHATEWVKYISGRSLMTMKLKRLKGPEELPDTNDLVKLKDHLDSVISQLVQKITRRYSYSTYRNLLEYTLAALILFNKRRGGEAAKLLLRTYVDRRVWMCGGNPQTMK